VYVPKAHGDPHVWQHATPEDGASSAALSANGATLFIGPDSNVYALRTHDGSLVWKYATDGGVNSPIPYGAGQGADQDGDQDADQDADQEPAPGASLIGTVVITAHIATASAAAARAAAASARQRRRGLQGRRRLRQ
jgi:outer membrane protein assembly factor BamB